MLRIRFQLDSALDRLQGLAGRLQDPEALLGPAVPVVAAAIERNFEQEGRPERWVPLTPGYARWKAARFPGTRILELTGALRRSIVTQIESGAGGSASIVVSTNVPYAAAHQFGVPRRNLPPRPFLVLTRDDTDEIARVLAATLTEQ